MNRPPDMRRYWQAIDLGQPLVDSDVAELSIEHTKPDRRRVVVGFDFSEPFQRQITVARSRIRPLSRVLSRHVRGAFGGGMWHANRLSSERRTEAREFRYNPRGSGLISAANRKAARALFVLRA